MKIALNLSTAPSPSERYGLAWAIPALVVGLAGLVFLSTLGVRAFREYRTVHQSLLALQQTEAQLHHRETALRREFEKPEIREVFRQVRFVNSLIDKKQFSLSDLVQEVSKLLPAEVRLEGMALGDSGNDRVVRFALVGNDEQAAETFLSNLEDSPDFSDVAILNQGYAQEGATGGAVTIACTARYLGGQAGADAGRK
jgi:hypothetical protein